WMGGTRGLAPAREANTHAITQELYTRGDNPIAGAETAPDAHTAFRSSVHGDWRPANRLARRIDDKHHGATAGVGQRRQWNHERRRLVVDAQRDRRGHAEPHHLP